MYIQSQEFFSSAVSQNVASVAEFEREIIRERTNAGLAAARARGRTGGRKAGLSEDAKRKARIAESYYEEGMAVNQIAKNLGISKATLYRYLRFRGVNNIYP